MPGTAMVDPNRWQPLALDLIVTQNGIPAARQGADLRRRAAGTGSRRSRSTRSDPNDLYSIPGPPPLLGTATDAAFKEVHRRVLELVEQLTPDDGVRIDISPGAFGNNPLGTNDGTGHR